jgi:hypothetical protein
LDVWLGVANLSLTIRSAKRLGGDCYRKETPRCSDGERREFLEVVLKRMSISRLNFVFPFRFLNVFSDCTTAYY